MSAAEVFDDEIDDSPESHAIKHIRRESNIAPDAPHKLLVANRSEIAVRIFRTAHELGLHTVAIYSQEDRLSMHRQKADEAYVIGKTGEYTPVAAYLAQDEIVKIAKAHGVTMVHPGYGFLSENASFARKVEEAGITWVGPRPETIDALGDKTKARTLAMKVGVPVVPGTEGPIESIAEAKEFVEQYGFPVIIKAAMGGGGRGMRVVTKQEDFEAAFQRATSEAKNAFGDGTCFIERFLIKPKHIEVQLLADGEGNCIHLYERDCSVQRRHQKVVEVAPAKGLPPALRQAILDDALKLARDVNYRNAGTAEFLVDAQGRHYFIEINPRIQVEHTITEEITGIDIVGAQIQIAGGATLKQLGLTQDAIQPRGFAIQCRITTEDPANSFAPDTGRIEVYRSAGGNGVRLDGGNGFAGAVISPHYDSMLVKCTCSGSTYEITRRKVLRALIEFRIRGLKTNIPFLLRLVTSDVFLQATYWTTYIDDTPELFQLYRSADRATKMLSYLGDLVVNGSQIVGQVGEPLLKTDAILPSIKKEGSEIDLSTPCQTGWRNVLEKDGPEAFAKAVRANKGTLIMDTTWRDAHQSLLATRVRTLDMLNIAPQTSYALSNAYALECWGGATFDVAMRFLYEDPWERLRKLRKAVPNIPFQMLLRGANGLAYSALPDNAIYFFVEQAKKNGVDIFRVFDALNDVENLKLGVDAVKKAGGVAEATVCISGDMLNPKKKYNLEYYLALVDQIVAMGGHVLGIKDMAGVLKPQAATKLISAIRAKYPDLPIHVHTHDSAGTGVASMVACAHAGADAIDVCSDSMSGMTSQPSIGAYMASMDGSGIGPGLDASQIKALDEYWSQLRLLYAPFDSDMKGPDPEVYDHEIPGGQLTNLRFQATQLGLGTQWAETKKAYVEANRLLGDIVKVTPTSKVVGDLAQFMVSNSLSFDDVMERAEDLDFPGSVLDFFEGLMGQPFGGFPEPLRTKALRGKRTPLSERPGKSLKPLDLAQIRKDLTSQYGSAGDTDVASFTQFPGVYKDYRTFISKYGDLSSLPTRFFLAKPQINEEIYVSVEQGKTFIIRLLAVGPLSDKTGTREVFFEFNGETRPVTIEDKKAGVENVARPKADAGNRNHVGAPLGGVIVELRAKSGSDVAKGDVLFILSSMKVETSVSAPLAGKIKDLKVSEGSSVSAGDLLAVIE